MPRLAKNRSVASRSPRLKLTNRFKAGRYVFRLQVEDDAGNTSRPVQIVVTVKKPGRTRIDPRILDVSRRRRVTDNILRPGRVIIPPRR